MNSRTFASLNMNTNITAYARDVSNILLGKYSVIVISHSGKKINSDSMLAYRYASLVLFSEASSREDSDL
jgi:hypothetical protein